MQARKMRLQHANIADSQWLRLVLEQISRDFGLQRAQASLVQCGGDEPVARAASAAAAAMGEDDRPGGPP